MAKTAKTLPAKVQFYDNLDFITARLSRRFPVKLIWEELQEDKKYTGDYTHFCRLIRSSGLQEEVQAPATQTRPLPRSTNQPTKPHQEVNTKKPAVNENPENKDEEGPAMYMGDLPRASNK